MEKQQLNILTVESSPEDHEIIRRFLQKDPEHEYIHLQAYTGEEGLEMCRSDTVDCIVLDFGLPDMDGLEFISALSGNHEQFPVAVVILTGQGNEEKAVKALKAGASDYLIMDGLTADLLIRTIHSSIESRRAEAALRESEQRYRNLVEDQTELICRSDKDGVLNYVNEPYCRYFGKHREELIGRCFLPLIPEGDGERLENHLASLDRKNPVGMIEHRVVSPNGSIRWLQWTNRAIFDGQGCFSEFQSVGRDVTERVKAQQALQKAHDELEMRVKERTAELTKANEKLLIEIEERKQAEETLRIKDAAINSSTSGFAFADLEEKLTYVNDSFLSLWGYDREKEVLGKSITKLWDVEQEAFEALQDLRANGYWIGEMTARRKDGSLFDIQVSANVVTNGAGKPVDIITASFIDITNRKEIEEAMMRSEKLSALGQLSAGLAHEVRNPLAVISSCAQFCLENMQMDRPLKENFQMIYWNSQKASRLISELLAFARPSHLAWEQVDINEVATKTWHMAQLELPSTCVTFEPRLKEALPKITGDKEKLGQVFLNLLQNAIQAVSGKGTIILQTQFDIPQNHVEINVIDDGPGIPEDYLSRIFDPFFTTKDNGTGLGLTICHTIVQQHKGTMNIESGRESGTKVSVRLPLKQE